MHSEDFSVDYSCDRQLIEELHRQVVNVVVVLSEDLQTESVLVRADACLVIASEQHDVLGPLQLETAQVRDDLPAVGSTVNVVSQEKQLVVLGAAPLRVVYVVDHIVQAAVDIADDGDLAVDLHQVRLPLQDVCRPQKKRGQAVFGELTAASNERLDQVEVDAAPFEPSIAGEMCLQRRGHFSHDPVLARILQIVTRQRCFRSNDFDH